MTNIFYIFLFFLAVALFIALFVIGVIGYYMIVLKLIRINREAELEAMNEAKDAALEKVAEKIRAGKL